MTKKPEDSKALARQESQALSTQRSERPDFIDAADQSGKEDISLKDVRLPRLVIAQGLSSQLIEGDSTHIDGLKMFDMFNDLTGEIYGRGPIEFIPMKRQEVRMEFDPNDRKVILDRNVPLGDKRLEWTKNPAGGPDLPPRATTFVEFAVLLVKGPNLYEPILVSMKQTNRFNRRAAERLTGFIKFQEGPIYASIKSLSSKIEKNDSGTFGVFHAENVGFIQDRDEYNYSKDFFTQIAGKRLAPVGEREPGDDVEFIDAETVQADRTSRPQM